MRFISANKPLYVTFAFSIIVHVGLIYTLPAVELFSEGFEGPSSDMIMVDFIEEETLEVSSEIPPVVDNQFLPPKPDEPVEEALSQPLEVSAPDEVEMTIPLPKDKSVEMDTQYTLLTNPVARDPEIELLRKRPLEKQDPAFQQKVPELPKSEKLAAEHQQPEPLQRPDMNKKPVLSSADLKNPQEKDTPEEDLRSPFEDYQPEKRQLTSFTENSLEKKLVFGKRPVKEIDRETTLSQSPFDSPSEVSKKRLVGLSKENEDDQNRFGIFAGKKFELPQMKETIKEVSAEEKQQALAEELENARTLEADEQIEGPIKGRIIVYRPQSPQVDVENEVEFRLKFWVLPDGTIGEVIPIKRGDTKLERIAIAYLKKWQFEPLSPEVPQRKIWGTIPIRFTVQ